MSVEQLPQEIKRICVEIFGMQPSAVTYIDQGVMNHKFKVSLIDKEYVFRFYITDGATKLAYEPELIKRFSSMNAKVPRVYAVSEKDFRCSYQVFVYEWIPGQSLSQTWIKKSVLEKEYLADQIKENYAIIGSHKLTGFGEVISEGHANALSWKEFLKHEIIENRKSMEENNVLGSAFEPLYEFVIAQINSMNEVGSFFLWSDMAFSNIIVNKNRLRAFLDFEHVLAGDPCLVPTYFFCRESRLIDYQFLERFFPNDFCSRTKMKLYGALRLFRISKYLNRALPTGRSRGNIFEIFPGLEYLLQ